VVNATASWYLFEVKEPGRTISLLFDLFVLNQRVRRLVSAALAKVSLRADEYAVYSLLFEQAPLTATEMSRRMAMPLTTVLDYLTAIDERGHLRRERHPHDGRAQQLSLTIAGVTEHRRTNKAWEVMRARLERSLPMSEKAIRQALHAFDDAVAMTLVDFELESAASR
jgi:DNA-binding MarR family transcriptional regulator